ncbi:MAG TPA: DUF2383 domain-containing protein [Solimonas sp.]
MNKQDFIIRKLNDLIELDYDAIEAYEEAIQRLQSTDYKSQLAAFCADHERHTLNLGLIVTALGGTPATGPDLMRVLTKGKVVLADLVGHDHTILLAMRANEAVTNKRYELALEVDGMDEGTRAQVRENLGDERRHRDWIDAQLEKHKTRKAA